MRITSLAPHPLRPERMRVHLDGAPRTELAAELVVAERLRAGDELDETRLAELEAQDREWRARDAALALLAHRPRTAEELRRRLARRGFDAGVVDACVEGLGNLGMVDDAAFAEGFVRDRVRLRPHGRRRLRQELRARGLDEATARTAIDEVLGGEGASELELARAAAARWRPRAGEGPERARRRLFGFLARRGFGGEAVRQVLGEKLGPAPDV